MKAINKDIARTIRKEGRRFLSMSIIAVLGVTMFCGLKAGCDDLRETADKFFDEQDLHDVYVQSTLGLTEDDVAALGALEGVERISAFYTEEVQTVVDTVNKTALIKVLDPEGMNTPYVLDGALPASADEIAVTQNYILQTGKKVGDTVTFIETDLEDDEEEDKTEEEAKEEETKEEETSKKKKKKDKDKDDEDFTIDASKYEIEDEVTPTFANTTYTISAVVIDPMDINYSDGSSNLRDTSACDFTWFVLPEAVDSDIYTGVGIVISGMKEIFCFTDEYDQTARDMMNRIADSVKELREKERTQAVKDEAEQTIKDAEDEMNEAFEEVDQKFADAWDEIQDGQKELDDAQKELDDGLQEGKDKIADGRDQISDGYSQMEAGQNKLNNAEAELRAGESELEKNERLVASLEKEISAAEKKISNAKSEMSSAQSKIDSARTQISEYEAEVADGLDTVSYYESQVSAAKSEVSAQESYVSSKRAELSAAKDSMDPDEVASIEAELSAAESQLASARNELEANSAALSAQRSELEGQKAQLNSARAELEAQEDALYEARQALEENEAAVVSGRYELEDAKAELAAARRKIENGKAQIAEGKAEIEAGRNELDNAQKELNQEESKMYDEVAKGQSEIDDGRKELEEGIEEYNENQEKYQDKKAEAESKLSDARQELVELDDATWYIQNRYSLSGYNNLINDMSAIESLGVVFAIIFLCIAVLICLTTVTRMVEEDRGLIGTYQALGYKNSEIRSKYMKFSLFACFFGCMVGEVLGFLAIPKFLGLYFATMYVLPPMGYGINWAFFFIGPAAFMVTIGIAVLLTTRKSLQQTPATLMRPKAPKAGSRVFLEYIPFIWKNMSFLNKVTARNLFRYKKRLIMTILGIAGCTSILLSVFGLKDTVFDLLDRQYAEITNYSWMGIVDGEDMETLKADLSAEDSVTSYISLEIQSVSLINADGETMTVPLYILPEGTDISDYITINDTATGEAAVLSDEGILVTKNASDVLKFGVGDTLTIQDPAFYTNQFTVTGVLQNFLGNNIFMTQKLFDETFGNFEENACLAIMEDTEAAQTFMDEEAEKEMIISSSSTSKMKDEFEVSFELTNKVVYLMTLMAAALAFVVLFTLSNTNISERERELATIKVLGFYDREVHTYVNKETIILTLIGIALGIPMGVGQLYGQMSLMTMPEVVFVPTLKPISYVIAAVMSFAFALIVNQLTNRTLNKINPVEALKSIE